MTNLTLNLTVLVLLLVASARVLRRLRTWPVVCTTLHLSILTLVFDTAMIAAGLYVFDPAKIVGIYLWGAPLEDFAYAIAAAVAMPVLWTALSGRRARRVRRVRRAGAGPTAGDEAAS